MMILDLCVMYQHEEELRYVYAGSNTLCLEKYTGQGFLVNLLPDGSGYAIYCDKRTIGDRETQHNVGATWTEPMLPGQAMKLRPILEKVRPDHAGMLEIHMPECEFQEEEIESSSSAELMAGVLEAAFTDSCLLVEKNLNEEAICHVLSCLPLLHCGVSFALPLPEGADLCAVNMVELPLTIFPQKRVFSLGESETYLPLAETIAQADPKLRRYVVEENDFAVYLSLLAISQDKPPTQVQLKALLRAWEFLAPQIQKEILQQVVSFAELREPPSQSRRSLNAFGGVPPKPWNIAAFPICGVLVYQAALVGVIPFTVLFAFVCFVCMYWRKG